jgi:hypothetical protein
VRSRLFGIGQLELRDAATSRSLVAFFGGKLESLQSDDDDYGGEHQRSQDLMVCVQLRLVAWVAMCVPSQRSL